MFKKLGKFFGWWMFGLFAVLILVVGFSLRIYNLNSLPIFADEAIYVRWAQVMKAESTLRFLPLSDGKQPLFMWVVIPFLKIFQDPLFAGRIVSVLTGMGTLIGIITAVLVLFKSKKQALLAGLLYIVIPFAVFFDRMALVDSMLSMFGIWTFVLAIITVKTLRLDYSILTGFALGGAWLTKSPALFFTLLLPTVLILADWKGGWKLKLIHFLKLGFLIFVSCFLSQIIFNILRLGPNFHLLTSRNMDYVNPINHILIRPLDPLIPHIKDILDWYIRLGTKPMLLLFLVGLFVGLKKRTKEVFLVLLWLFVPLLIQAEYAKVFTARYILFSLPFFLMVATSWLWAKSRLLHLFLGFVVFAVLVLSFRQDYLFLTNPQKADLPRSDRSGYLEEWTSGYGIKETADYIRTGYLRSPKERIVVGTEGYFGTLPDGLQIYLNDLPQVIVVGTEVKFIEVPQKLLDAKRAGNKVYLLANNTRIKIKNPEDYDLKLIKSYPKALRAPDTREFYLNGPQESLMFFELVK